MSVSNNQDATAEVFNEAFISRKVDSPIISNIIMPADKFIYIGSPTVDNCIRIGNSSGVAIFEVRKSGVWESMGKMEF